jgi:hypothetical protein
VKINMYGWPEPYIYTVYDRVFGDFPARNTIYTPYMYGSGQPYKYVDIISVVDQPSSRRLVQFCRLRDTSHNASL